MRAEQIAPEAAGNAENGENILTCEIGDSKKMPDRKPWKLPWVAGHAGGKGE